MNIAERQVEFPIDKNQDTLRKSLDRLELKYEKALQEWQQTSVSLTIVFNHIWFHNLSQKRLYFNVILKDLSNFSSIDLDLQLTNNFTGHIYLV